MTTRRRWLAGLAAIALMVFTAGPSLAVSPGPLAASVTVARPAGQLKCDTKITVKATVLDAAGKPIAGQPVTWSWKSRVSGKDKILVKTSTTNSNGVAKTTVVLACVPGSRVLWAKADNVRGSAVLNLTAGGLPNTSTLPVEPAVPSQLPPIGALLAVLALATGGGLVAHRVRVRR